MGQAHGELEVRLTDIKQTLTIPGLAFRAPKVRFSESSTMIDQQTGVNRVVLGDPVPLFSAPLVTGGSFDLHVSAGRWVVLSFLGSPSNPRAMVEIDELVRASSSLGEDHVAIGCVLTGQPDDMANLTALTSNKLFFLADYDGAITRSFGAHEMPRTVVLDPMLRAIADKIGRAHV